MMKMIVNAPGRKPIRHEGFDVLVNPSMRSHPWMRCCEGVEIATGLALGARESLMVLEDDVMLAPDFDKMLDHASHRGMLEEPYPAVYIFYVPADIGVPVKDSPYRYPPDLCPWGTQAMFYNASAVEIVHHICRAYLACHVAGTVNDYRGDTRGEGAGVYDGYDVVLYQTLFRLNIKPWYYAGVQHMCKKTTCLSARHTSPFFPPPEKIKQGVDGWH
jgi:hypothetical protein